MIAVIVCRVSVTVVIAAIIVAVVIAAVAVAVEVADIPVAIAIAATGRNDEHCDGNRAGTDERTPADVIVARYGANRGQ
ncbi:hypothetical protein [Bradyrhizobium canariense]|uniref:hypothetical protein n=1 Tax=Bradyrhizobium canariense TaxID=255045 RepID=UPI0014322C1D|nr:hypothetical protein [Bradyrhizobium canariense]